jgi:peroxiredoxin
MGLTQELADFQAKVARTAPAGRTALFEAKIEELRAAFASDRAVGIGDRAPDFTLPNARGIPVSLSAALGDGPAVMTFYRGGWCPYCNLQLRAYQRALPEIVNLGARLIAISPQSPDGSLSTAEENELAFDVLSDSGNRVARDYGIVFSLPEELRAAMTAIGKALPGLNGDESWELPVPATYVIEPDGTIAAAHVEVNWRIRLDPEDIVAALRSLRSAGVRGVRA